MENTKTTITTIALVLTLTISTILVTFPVAIAQEPPTLQSYPFIGAIPNPVGVNQEVLLHVGITQQLSSAEMGWEGLSITITRPDGETEVISNIRTDSTGGTGRVYVPTMAGTYYLQAHFPEQVTKEGKTIPSFPIGTKILAGDSEVLELVVQEEPVPIYPGHQLPKEYWTRPIDAQMREWSSISGNWLECWPYVPWDPSARIAPYNDGPETGHILWAKKLIAMGGLVGGDLGEHGFESGDAYEGKWLPPVIIGGVLFYNQFQAGGGSNVEQIVVAVDLRTGEELWARPLIGPDGVSHRLAFGQLFFFDSYNYHGVFGYLWATKGSTWHAFDPSTGRWVYSMENVPNGFRVHGPKGEIYIYTVNQWRGWMTLWNSSRVVTYGRTGPAGGSWLWGREGSIFDARNGIEWNVTIPEGLPTGGDVQEPTGLAGDLGVRAVFFEDRIILSSDMRWNQIPVDYIHLAGINVKPGHEGELLFNVTWTPPQPPKSAVVKLASVEDGVIIMGVKETRNYVALSIDTGEQLWETEPMHYLEIYTATNDRRSVAQIYDGKFFAGGMSGIVYCYDTSNGALLWEHEVSDPYNEILWGNNWPVYGSFVADGKLYVHTCEHSPLDPKPRGNPFVCLDIETGEEIWSINLRGHHWGGYPVIGDSTIAIYNTYDQRIYALGKGPSETTVAASPKVSTLGSKVIVEGTVIDVSPGTKDLALTMRFPKGVPAVSDDSMSAWMEYVYLQHERPQDVTGVPVKLEVISDPNGNYYDIGTATTDLSGFYSIAWQPPVPGHYIIKATFEGSESYYPSSVETSIYVAEAPTPAVPIEPEQPTQPTQPEQPEQPTQPEQPEAPTEPEQPAEAPFITTEQLIATAVIVAVVIGATSLYALRKQRK